MAIIADSTSLFIPIYVLHYPKEEVLSLPGIVRVIFTLLYILILSAFIFTLISIGIKNICLSGLQKIIAVTISITCIMIEQMNLIAIINLATNKGLLISMNISIFSLVFFLYFCLMFYIYNLGMEKEKNEQLMAESFISKMNRIQYEQIISSTEALRGIKHDISNHLETLSLLIKSKEYEIATEYLNRIFSELSLNHMVSTGNVPVDCIISNKYALANNSGITFDYTIHLPKKLPLDDVAICSLLGNILDNTIESCEKISSSKKRYISLTIFSFLLLRNFIGGYHASSHIRCIVLSSIVGILSIILISHISTELFIFKIIIIVLLFIVFLVIGPMIQNESYKYMQQSLRQKAIVTFVIYIASILFFLNLHYWASLYIGTISACVLYIIEFLIRKYKSI